MPEELRKRPTWAGMLAGLVADAGRRVVGLAFGKAIAFTYAVVVSVVANIVFDFVRNPPHTGSTDAVTPAAVKSAGAVVVRAPLPALQPATAAKAAPNDTAPPAPPLPENPRPGPGSGGLY